MKKLTLALAGLALVAASLAGCIDDRGRRHGGSLGPTCEKFRACDSCTRTLGCGWCMSGSQGLCVSEPNECASALSFSFNWDPSGCPGGSAADGGIDYGAPVGPSSTDAAPTGADGGAAQAADASAEVSTDAGADAVVD